MRARDPLIPRIGAALGITGGVLCVVGFSLPWITFRIPGDGGAITSSTFNGWRAAAEAGPVGVLPALLPLLMGVVALVVGVRALSGGVARGIWRLYWAATSAGLLVLLVLTYGFDPFGLDPETLWVLQREPSPLIGPGFSAMYLGVCALLVGGALARQRRPRAMPNQAAV